MRPSFAVTASVTTLFLACLCAVAQPSSAQDYPDRPIKLIVPYTPGGGTDQVSRIVADELGKVLPQRVVIENRGGANGTTGANAVAKSAPDGYTLLAGAPGPITIGPYVQTMPYDPLKDLVPIAMVSYSPFMMAVTNSMPAKTLSEVIAYIKSQPGKLRFASNGNGSSPHLAGEMFSKEAGVKMIHVPYAGSGQAIPDFIAGRVEVFITSNDALTPLATAGQVRAIASASMKRATAMPDLPTFDELGMKGYEIGTWVGIMAPAGTPQPIVDKLYSAIEKVIKGFEGKQPFAGAEPRLMNPGDFAAYLKKESDKVGAVVADLGLPKQ
jgi:tripartite-type tricarboxylate transporter receptor subunit TctC